MCVPLLARDHSRPRETEGDLLFLLASYCPGGTHTRAAHSEEVPRSHEVPADADAEEKSVAEAEHVPRWDSMLQLLMERGQQQHHLQTTMALATISIVALVVRVPEQGGIRDTPR